MQAPAADQGHAEMSVDTNISVDTNMENAGPGWYYDPRDEAIYRFWDGEAWTDRLSDTITAEIPRPT